MLSFIDPVSLAIGYVAGMLLCWSLTETLYTHPEEGEED